MGWIRKRLKEASTKNAIGTVFLVLSGIMPQYAEVLAAAGALAAAIAAAQPG